MLSVISSSDDARRAFRDFLSDFSDQIRISEGELQTETTDFIPVSSRRVVAALHEISGLTGLPRPSDEIGVIDALCQWIMAASDEEKAVAGLDLPVPPKVIHHVAGRYPIFYDFRNLDIVLTELVRAGAKIEGRFLDFGCSSGRSLAVLKRAFPDRLELFGVDPSGASINWLEQHIDGVTACQSSQSPPLGFADDFLDIVIAKSIWTHFSPPAAKAWFAEIGRCLKPGGHFFFSTHGPHDVASRILRDLPRPKYERYTGHPHWTRDEFLMAIIEGFRADGHFFAAFREIYHQADLRGAAQPTTADWGLSFLLPGFVETLLPEGLSVVRHEAARTASRHDAYVVRKAA